MSLEWSQWQSWHFYYHGDRNLLLERLSTQPLPAELVLRRTREILAADASETDANLYPDNSVRPATPEVDRYGGPELIGASLDFASCRR